jgi:hypothetical protein
MGPVYTGDPVSLAFHGEGGRWCSVWISKFLCVPGSRTYAKHAK